MQVVSECPPPPVEIRIYVKMEFHHYSGWVGGWWRKGARTVVVRIINMLPDKLVMAGIIVLIL